MEAEINLSASRQAKEFTRTTGTKTEELMQKAFLVYKFLLTPEHMLLHGLKMMLHNSDENPSSMLKQFFRRLSLQLHPDKNSHP
jgi:hypothetical protein